MGRSEYGASLGYMTLEIPAAMCPRGMPITLAIATVSSAIEVWYRLYPYGSSLQYFLSNEQRRIYYSWGTEDFGDATLTLVTQKGSEGETAVLQSHNSDLVRGTFARFADIDRLELRLTRDQEQGLAAPIIVSWGAGKIDTVEAPNLEERRIKALMEEEIDFDCYIFGPGKFPHPGWRHPKTVRNLIGSDELRTRYFDERFAEVERPEKPGRYAAVMECSTSTGFLVRRFATLYCVPVPFAVWIDKAEIGLSEWSSYQLAEFRRFLGGKDPMTLQTSADAAILLAGLEGMAAGSLPNDSPRIRDRQWWIDFKRNLLGDSQRQRDLRTPVGIPDSIRPVFSQTRVLRYNYHAADIERIRQICSSWAEQSGVPNETVVVCEGEIVFDEAFGKKADGAYVNKRSPMWMASITKLLTGALAMQFVDQGLIDLDAPVANYLPELPAQNAPALTMRDLFTHTNGFAWHGEWASDWNMALENYLAYCLPVCQVREKHQYNRMGYAVAGKVLERITGKSVPYLFYTHLLKPLGMTATFVDNTYGSCQSSAYDIALVGQMLLNKGKAGGRTYFSDQSFEKMLPHPVYGPNGRLEPDWGIGTAWLGGNGLSDKTFGHEAASGAILRIDPSLQLVIVSARDRIGPDYSIYELYRNRLFSAAAIAVKNRQRVY
jgi:CubicO group peptidase (beta-lactamase class C family)